VADCSIAQAGDTAMMMMPHAYVIPAKLGFLAIGMAIQALTQGDVEKATQLANEKREIKQQHEARAMQLVHDMRVLQDKQTKLVSTQMIYDTINAYLYQGY
jgi:primosomal protein N''